MSREVTRASAERILHQQGQTHGLFLMRERQPSKSKDEYVWSALARSICSGPGPRCLRLHAQPPFTRLDVDAARAAPTLHCRSWSGTESSIT